MQKKGLFCVVEGMDGSGKSTLLATLRSLLERRMTPTGISDADFSLLLGMPAVFLAEPTRLPTGIELRRRLAEPEPPLPAEWIELFRADRRANLDTYVLPALDRGDLVFQDRYYFSTAAYQGAFSELGPAAVLDLFASWCPAPDLLVVLDIDVETAFARMGERGGQREVFEERDRWIRIREAYDAILPASALRLNATMRSEEAAARVLAALAAILRGKRGREE